MVNEWSRKRIHFFLFLFSSYDDVINIRSKSNVDHQQKQEQKLARVNQVCFVASAIYNININRRRLYEHMKHKSYVTT